MELMNILSFTLVLLCSIIQVAEGCDSTANCLYTAWYFWFLVFWVLFFIGMGILYCVKKHQQRHRRIEVKPPELTRAKSPPPYSAPSHNPPAYTAHAPTGTMTSQSHSFGNPAYTPHAHSYSNPAYPPHGSVYPPPNSLPAYTDPAYPPGAAPY